MTHLVLDTVAHKHLALGRKIGHEHLRLLLAVEESQFEDLRVVWVSEHHPVVRVRHERIFNEARVLEKPVHGVAHGRVISGGPPGVHGLDCAEQLGREYHGHGPEHQPFPASRLGLLGERGLGGKGRRDAVGRGAQVGVINMEYGLGVALVDVVTNELAPAPLGKGSSRASGYSGEDLLHGAQIVVDDHHAGDGDDPALLIEGIRDFLVGELGQLRVIRGLGGDVRQVAVVSDPHGLHRPEIARVADVGSHQAAHAVI